MTIFLSMDDLRSEGSGNSVEGSHNSLLYLSPYDSRFITICKKLIERYSSTFK